MGCSVELALYSAPRSVTSSAEVGGKNVDVSNRLPRAQMENVCEKVLEVSSDEEDAIESVQPSPDSFRASSSLPFL